MKRLSLIACAVLLGASAVVSAQAPGSAPAPAAPTSGFRADFLAQLDDVSKKILDLAGAVPADKYSWRPEKGVRSISEVYMHIVVANYFLPSFMGVQPPAGHRPQHRDERHRQDEGPRDAAPVLRPRAHGRR